MGALPFRKSWAILGWKNRLFLKRKKQSKVYTGILLDGTAIDYIAVGSNNAIQGNITKLCGVAIGTSSYSNAGGGTTHAVSVVGYFSTPDY